MLLDTSRLPTRFLSGRGPRNAHYRLLRNASAWVFAAAVLMAPLVAANAGSVENPYPEARITQVPGGVLGPPGKPVPEAAPPKTVAAGASASPVTATRNLPRPVDCTGKDAASSACYAATQQARPLAR